MRHSERRGITWRALSRLAPRLPLSGTIVARRQKGLEDKIMKYIFCLEKFHIDNTRALHEDTDHVSFALKVGDQPLQPLTKHVGDVNNGDHSVGLQFTSDIADPRTPVLFNYQILNQGHGGDLDAELNAGADALAAGLGVTGNGLAGTLVKLLEKYGLELFNPNCDGPVAADQITVSAATLKDWTANNGVHRETRYYPGVDSAIGCGSNSKYKVTWSVARVPSKRTEGTSGFFLQSEFGNKGNFELLVPRADGGLVSFWRDNDAPDMPWKEPSVFAQAAGHVDAVSMIQSNFSAAGNGPGNLEVVCRIGNRLAFYWRKDTPPFNWSGAIFFADGISVAGTPSLIQSHFGIKGNFELLVPRADGGLVSFWRDNDAPNMPWKQAIALAQDVGHVDAVSMIQSNFSSAGNGPGNLEVVARIGNRLALFWRSDMPPFKWSGPIFFANQV